MAEKDVNITYETLFELLRRERSRAELQKLDKEFFKDIVEYLNWKKDVLNGQKAKIDLFSSTEKERTKKEIENIKKILKDIYERREGKIVNTALNKSRVPGILIDNSVFLDEEKKLFEQLVFLMDSYRKGIMFNILDGKMPVLEESGAEESEKEILKEEKKEVEKEVEKKNTEKKDRIVRFKNAVPSFVGTELEEYGPFEEDEIANLPLEIASVLVEKGRAEFIEES